MVRPVVLGACLLLAAPLAVSSAPAGSTEPARDGLRVGDAAPVFSFTDLDGKAGDVAALKGSVLVYTCADHSSYDGLLTWQGQVGVEVAKRHPDLPVAYLNVADVTVVPDALRPVVEPVLKKVVDNALSQLVGAYTAIGQPFNTAARQTFLIPDWDGRYLARLRLDGAPEYRAWIAVDGRVKAAFRPGEPNADARFLQVFAEAAAARAAAAAPPTSP